MTDARQSRATAHWPAQPIILEINTWVWLAELGARLGRRVDLATVPGEVWDTVVAPGVDAVWLMGVWERSPRGAAIARQHEGVAAEHRAALEDFTDGDVIGSAYCIRNYTVDRHLGGDDGLAAARAQLAQRGVLLVLDYVPNHVALDHPWVASQPDLFVHGSANEAHQRPREFVGVGGLIVALGRDPYFEPWQDVAQLNAFSPALRRQTVTTLAEIAQRADGIRCDMAMLMVNDVFAGTWGDRVGDPPAQEFWPLVIRELRRQHPNLVLLAEVYWDMEAVLLEQGFDYCYDKRLHDRLVDGDIAGLREHLQADVGYQRHLVRFVENHDERRAAVALDPSLWRAAAVVALTLPGAVLLYEGQSDARTARPPVALGRRPHEAGDDVLRDFYTALLTVVEQTALRDGEWQLHEVRGWPDDSTAARLLAWSWSSATARHLVVVNLSAAAARGQVVLPWKLRPSALTFRDPLQGHHFTRRGDHLAAEGLHVELGAGGWHLLQIDTS